MAVTRMVPTPGHVAGFVTHADLTYMQGIADGILQGQGTPDNMRAPSGYYVFARYDFMQRKAIFFVTACGSSIARFARESVPIESL